MKPYVVDLVVNEEVTSFFLVSEAPQVRKSKRGSDYLCIKLQDKTGGIDGRVWDIPAALEIDKLIPGAIVKVQGQVTAWNEENQIGIKQIRFAVESDQVEVGDFYERSERDPVDMFEDLCSMIQLPDNDSVRTLLSHLLIDNRDKLLFAPAAKTVHHNYIGGLLEHMLSLCQTALVISKRYKLRTDLMLAACVLHDIGKIHELTYPVISYSVEGTLLGHIQIGFDMVSKAMDQIQEFPPVLRMEVLHMIVSHHGQLEWGSPKLPLMREAIAFHLIDMVDAKMAMCDRAIKKKVNADGMTDWVKELGGPIFTGGKHDQVGTAHSQADVPSEG